MKAERVITGLVVGLVLQTLGSTASAQCPDPLERVLTFPSNGASGVPVNVVLRAEYPATLTPGGRPSWLIFYGSGSSLSGEAGWDGATATFVPDAELEARTAYYARVTDEVSGEFVEFSFATGNGRDRGGPSFAGIESVSWEHASAEQLQDSCSLWVGASFLLDLSFPAASDDTPADELCYYVYQTEGPGVDEERIVARLRRDDGEVRLLLSEEAGEGHLCYRMRVRDLAGSFDGNGRERCADPIVDQVFHDACSVAPGSRRDPGRWLPLVVAFAVVLLLGRARRGR